MVAPIIAAGIRVIGGAVLKSGAEGVAKKTATEIAKDAASDAAKKATASRITAAAVNATKKSVTSAAKNAVSKNTITREINSASKKMSKVGRELPSDIISDAKKTARSTASSVLKVPDSVAIRIAKASVKDGYAGAASELESYITGVISRQRKAITTAKTVLKLSGEDDRVKLVNSVLDNASKGMTFPEAANKALKDNEGRLTIGNPGLKGGTNYRTGAEATRMAAKIDSANEARSDYKDLSERPATVQNYRMRELGLTPTGKVDDTGFRVWLADNGREYTIADVEGLASVTGNIDGVTPKNISIDYANRESGKNVAYHLIAPTERWAANLGKSLRSAGVDKLSPRIYNDIMNAVSTMSPSKLAYVAGLSPTRRRAVMYKGRPRVLVKSVWLSSETVATRHEIKSILRAFDLDIDKYTEGEIYLMPELDDFSQSLYDD